MKCFVRSFTFTLSALAVASVSALAQPEAPSAPERITVPFRNPSAPKMLKVEVITGSITVTGYDGSEALVEYTSRGARPRVNASEPPPGMHRLSQPAGDVDVDEDENTVKVRVRRLPNVDVSIKVPKQTSVNLRTMSGEITVDEIAGEVEVEALNGSIAVRNTSGAVVAHSMNGKITAVLTKASADKPSSFSTMNGEIDVSLPADQKARLKLKTDRGDIFTDFDVKAETSGGQDDDDRRGKNRRPRVLPIQTINGTINGGGPEMRFTSYNGRIVIRKR